MSAGTDCRPNTGAVPTRLEFETLIADTSASMIAASDDGLDAAIAAALERLRLFFDADHCALLRIEDDLRAGGIAHETYAPGIPRVVDGLDLMALFPWSARRLVVEREPLVVHRLADLPPEAATDIASWQRYFPIRSNVTVPIPIGPVMRDAIVIEWLRNEVRIPDTFISRLRLLGQTLVTALARKAAGERVREQAARLALVADAVGMGFSERIRRDGPLFVDAQLCELLGIPQDAAGAIDDLWLSRVDDEARAAIGELRRRLWMRETDAAECEYRYHHPARGTIWLRHVGRGLEVAGTPPRRRVISAIQDITTLKRREEELTAALDEVRRLRDRLHTENVYLREEIGRAGNGHVVGRSAALRRAVALAESVAPTATTVLLVGETGTGKERFASLIHGASPRAARTMVRVNCAAIPAALVESELFGRERGAYTGAVSRQIGRFELAHGSTLFLDEVGDLPLEVQVKLLRVLQEQTIERLGSPQPIRIDVRIIAATHRDLEQLVREGRFREDLWYRLNVFPVPVPPLRARPADIPLLASALVEEIGGRMGKRFDSIARASLEALTAHSWPGNVRELRNVLERAMILSPGPILQVDEWSLAAATSATPAAPTRLEDVERRHILSVLDATAWRIKGPNSAAARLGMKPSTLYFRMKKLGITRRSGYSPFPGQPAVSEAGSTPAIGEIANVFRATSTASAVLLSATWSNW
jgi:transcriptional regulator with GAF, ATPase, and Fis domain